MVLRVELRKWRSLLLYRISSHTQSWDSETSPQHHILLNSHVTYINTREDNGVFPSVCNRTLSRLPYQCKSSVNKFTRLYTIGPRLSYISEILNCAMIYDVDIGFDCHTTIKNIVVFRIFLLLKVSEVKFIRMHRLLSSIPCLYYTTLAKPAPLLVFTELKIIHLNFILCIRWQIFPTWSMLIGVSSSDSISWFYHDIPKIHIPTAPWHHHGFTRCSFSTKFY